MGFKELPDWRIHHNAEDGAPGGSTEHQPSPHPMPCPKHPLPLVVPGVVSFIINGYLEVNVFLSSELLIEPEVAVKGTFEFVVCWQKMWVTHD